MQKRTLAILLASLVAPCAFAQGQVHVLINGQPLSFRDTQPQQMNGHVLVPLRGIFEALGATVKWNQAIQGVKADKGSIDIQLRIGDATAYVNGQPVHLDVAAAILGGSTMVPLRFVSEALGAKVDWSNATQTVSIHTDGAMGGGQLSLSADRQGMIGSRTQVTFTLSGPAGGDADLQIPGLVDQIPMRETSPGVYSVTWSPERRSGVIINGTTAIAHLSVNGGNQLAQLSTPLSIDTDPPRLIPISPSASGQIENTRPDMFLKMDDGPGSGVDVRSVRLRLDDHDITNRAQVSPTRVVLFPDFDLTAGPHTIEVTARDNAGNPAGTHWTFIIAPDAGSRYRFGWTPPSQLAPGQVIAFTLDGEPGGDVSCDVGSRAGLVHMREAKPGHYVGEYVIRPGDHFDDEPVFARFRGHDNQTMSIQAERHLKIPFVGFLQPIIDSPRPSDRVDSPVVIEGRAAPFSTVHIHIQYSATILSVIHVGGGLTDIEVTTDEHGHFRSNPVDLGIAKGSDATYTASVYAIGPQGKRSPATEISFRSH